MIYTSYFNKVKNLPDLENYTLINISRNPPVWFKSEFVTIKEFLPPDWDLVSRMKDGDEKAFEEYRHHLIKVHHPALMHLGAYEDHDVLLLCHEKDSEKCHRKVLRTLLNEWEIPCKEL